MTCPECGSEGSMVERTFKSTEVTRIRACRCGVKWSTIEKFGRILTKTYSGVPRLPIASNVIAEVMARDGHRCRYCGIGGKLGIDHVVPLAAAITSGRSREEETAWRNSAENLVACCQKCNERKGDRVDGHRTGGKYHHPPVPAAPNSQIAQLETAETNDSTKTPTLFLDQIRSDPAPLSDLRLDLSQEVDREKAAYEQDFLSFWEAIEPIGRRKGDKAEAQKVWRKKRRPNSANLIVGWRRYRNSCGDGYTMDADRWLRGDGWLKEWEAAPAERTNGISSQYPKIKELPPGILPPPRPRP